MRIIIILFNIFVILSYQNTWYKDAENRTRSNFFMMDESFGGSVCKHDWHNVRSYLVFTMQKFQFQCAMNLTPYKSN